MIQWLVLLLQLRLGLRYLVRERRNCHCIFAHHFSAEGRYSVTWTHRVVAFFRFFLNGLPEPSIQLSVNFIDWILEIFHLLLIGVDYWLNLYLRRRWINWLFKRSDTYFLSDTCFYWVFKTVNYSSLIRFQNGRWSLRLKRFLCRINRLWRNRLLLPRFNCVSNESIGSCW
jgi:hypothetical protein